MRTLSFALTLSISLLAACGEKEPVDSADDSAVDLVDADGDGFSEEEDCDDSDAAVNPDAAESCDGVDTTGPRWVRWGGR